MEKHSYMNTLTLKYKQKTISIIPPKTLMHLKYNINKLLETHQVPSNFLIFHDKLEVNPYIYESLISKVGAELTIIEKENDPYQLFYITNRYIEIFSSIDKKPFQAENSSIH
jgi:hypothetical protein